MISHTEMDGDTNGRDALYQRGMMANLKTLRHVMWPRVNYLIGFEEEDLSSLEGLSAEDLAALGELAGLSDEELEELQGTQPDEKDVAIEGYKEALRKERTQRRELAKELKALKAGKPAPKPTPKGGKKEDDEEESSDSASQEELQRERQKSEKLAERFATNAVDTSILKILNGGDKKLPQFQDTDDVIRLIDRSMISVDQEDDAPDQIEIDEDTVKDALKKLAKSKPHLLLKEKEEGGEEAGGGSRFGGGRKPPSQKDREAELKKKYPALGRR